MKEYSRLAFAAAVLVFAAVLACSDDDGDAPEEVPTPAPRVSATVVGTGPTVVSSAPCPVPNDACRLAIEFLPLIVQGDAQAIVARSSKQALNCPASLDPTFGLEGNLGKVGPSHFIEVCAGLPPYARVEVYEVHGGKGFFLSPSETEYANRVTSFVASMPADLRIVAVGCVMAESPPAPACERSAVAVYGWRERDGLASDNTVALVFARKSPEEDWTVERLWAPWPGTVKPPVPPGHRVSVSNARGDQSFEFQPFGP